MKTGNDITSALNILDTVTVEGVDYTIYSDGGFVHAVKTADVDAADEVEVEDYTAWCALVPAVHSRDTALAILAEVDASLVTDVLHLGDGCNTAVRASDLSTYARIDDAGTVVATVRAAHSAQAVRLLGGRAPRIVIVDGDAGVGDAVEVDGEGVARVA